MTQANYMGKITRDSFSLDREQGQKSIPENFEVFSHLVAQATDALNAGKYDLASVYCEMAASYASSKACGLFVSSDLEQILLTIGHKTIHSSVDSERPQAVAGTPKILHVATSMVTIGGHSRMLWRWIQQDRSHSHSLVLTRQFPKPVPQALLAAIEQSNGQVYQLNRNPGSIIDWAKQLRDLAATVDLVILHAHNFDVIPTIAFANKQLSPPICLLDHADHLFWLGASISDVVISLRESGMQLAQSRRNIDPQRNVLLPIVLEPTHRNLTRDLAKQQLGIPKDSVLLLSIARSIKYKTVNNISFADDHVLLLQKYPQAILIVVGPGDRPDWNSAIEQTQGRIKVLSETEDTAVLYQAADIYIDSFPFVSNTSLLEAGSYGSPLVSRYPYPSAASAILGADMPGLTGNLIRANNLEEYTKVLSKLIEDPEFRRSLGAATRCKIAHTHVGDAWQRSLERVYTSAYTIPKISASAHFVDKMCLGDPDCFLQHVHRSDTSEDKLIQWYLPLMPFADRLYYWIIMFKKYGLKNPINLMFPEWFRSNYYGWKVTLKSLLTGLR